MANLNEEVINMNDHDNEKLFEAESIIDSKDISNEEKNQALAKVVKHIENDHGKAHISEHDKETEENIE